MTVSAEKRTDNGQLPLVSVLVPVYNGAEFLPATLDSLLRQNYARFEVVCFDDGSSDGSWSVLQSYCRKAPQIFKVGRSEANFGVSTAIRSCMGLISVDSTLLLFFAQDDVLPRNFVEEMVKKQRRSNATTVTCVSWAVDRDGTSLGIALSPGLLPPSTSLAPEFLRARNVVAGIGVLVRRAHYSADFLNADNSQCQDWEQWIELSRRGRVAVATRTNAYYRISADSLSHGSGNERYERDALTMRSRTRPQDLAYRGTSVGAWLRKRLDRATDRVFREDLAAQTRSLASGAPVGAGGRSLRRRELDLREVRAMPSWRNRMAVVRTTLSLYWRVGQACMTTREQV